MTNTATNTTRAPSGGRVLVYIATLVNMASCGPAAHPRPNLPERGSTYTVLRDAAGPRLQSEIEEVERAIRYDPAHLVEMEEAHRLAGIKKGELVLVIDLDIGVLRGSWAQVRSLQGQARGTVWIPLDAIQGVRK